MRRETIILLEDDSTRLEQFKKAVGEISPSYQLRMWRDAARLIAECHEVLSDAALISLDHDLNKERPDSPDPGDGVMAAEFLARLPPICPVILHTSNAERYWSMHNEFRFAGWRAERVIPLGDGWIEKTWLPLAQTLLQDFDKAGCYPLDKCDDQRERFNRALLSLHGLALGDGIGEMLFSHPDRAYAVITQDQLPPGPWWHTDDTEMAISIVEVLRLLGTIHQDTLARQFAWRFRRDPERGYGRGARLQLRMILEGLDWRTTARDAFSGQGSLGNGSAMRVAPVGAWFAEDLDRVVKEARASAMVTHMHSEGIAGAIAVAVAAAMAWRLRGERTSKAVEEFFNEVHKRTPDSDTRRGIADAFHLREVESPQTAARKLGNGFQVTCPDTVPFALWAAAKHLWDFREAIALTASVGGDSDTNCAIVGGIVALASGWAGLPTQWLALMEKLPYAANPALK